MYGAYASPMECLGIIHLRMPRKDIQELGRSPFDSSHRIWNSAVSPVASYTKDAYGIDLYPSQTPVSLRG